MLLKRAAHRLQPSLTHPRIVMHERDAIPSRQRCTKVAGTGKPEVDRRRRHSHAFVLDLASDIEHGLVGTIEDKKRLAGLSAALPERRQAGSEALSVLPHRDDDADYQPWRSGHV